MDTYEGCKDSFNVGQTSFEYEKRHSGRDYGKAKQTLKAFGSNYIKFGWWTERELVDHDIHQWLITIPNIRKIGKETFKIINDSYTLEMIRDMIQEKFFSDKEEKKNNVFLRQYQKEFVKSILDSWKNTDEFLLFAKCRAGKSVMVLSHIVDMGFKVSLITSRQKSPKQSWQKDAECFHEFRNIRFINICEKNWKEQFDFYFKKKEIQIVLWETVQGLQRKLNFIDNNIDLLVFDECHIGSYASQFQKVRKYFSKTRCLQISGTAHKHIWEYGKNQSFIYSYWDEQLDVSKGLYKRPKMNVIVAKYESDEYQKLFGDDPDAMKNIFCVDDNGEFTNPQLVRDFVNNYINTQKHLRPDDRLLNESQHIYMTLPSVAACHAIAKMIKTYSPLVVTGETNHDSEDILKHISENEKTITLTRIANVLGVTAPWDTIINCAEGSSIEFWIQFAFRGGSGDYDWKVIDFCPQRCLESLRHSFIMSCDSNQELAEYKFTDFVPITEWNNGFNTLSEDKIIDILSEDVSNTIKIMSGIASLVDFNKLNELSFSTNLTSSCTPIETKQVIVNDNNSNGKSNLLMVSSPTKNLSLGSESQDSDNIQKKFETIKSILDCIPLTIFYCLNNDIVPKTIDTIINSPYYVSNTLDNENIIKTAIEKNVIDSKKINYRINQVVVNIQNSMKKDILYTLEQLTQSSSTHKSLSVNIVKLLLK
jgi:Type III restriction enzyme, res subunit